MKKSRASLSIRIHSEEVPVRGVPHLRCPGCDERLINLKQSREIRLQAHDRYRAKHGLLSPREIQVLREGLSLTQAQLADLLQLGANTISRWEADRLVQSSSMDVLLRLIRDVPENLRYLKEHAA
jgi:putative zinc finger/helix-turn-helix YgiT family protein